jgi:hypothetical protein
MRTTQGAVLVGDPAAGNPYERASDYLEMAMAAAWRHAAEDPTGYRWQDAIFALGIAQMGLPSSMTTTNDSPLTCLELARAASDALVAIPPDRRGTDHLLTLAYVHDALRAIQDAADETPQA